MMNFHFQRFNSEKDIKTKTLQQQRPTSPQMFSSETLFFPDENSDGFGKKKQFSD